MLHLKAIEARGFEKMLIDVRCQKSTCRKLLARITDKSFGVIFLKCNKCKHDNTISLGTILQERGNLPAFTSKK